MKVAFLVNDLQLSGGIGVVVQHARNLVHDHGFDVTLVLVRPQDDPHWRYESLEGLRVESIAEASHEHFDVAVATWWKTTFSLFAVPATRYAYFVQSLEDRFYKPDEADRYIAGLTLDLPVAFITEARWIAETLRQLRPDAPCYLVRNGVDKEVFALPDRVVPRYDEPLRVLIEGNPSTWFKGVHEAIDVVGHMERPRDVTLVTSERDDEWAGGVDRVVGPVDHREMARLYGTSDVVLKLSRVEGMYGPPLEGFHRGATCVTTEVTGHDEYVVHGWNGLITDWDDTAGTARQLDLLAGDRRFLHFLRYNAVETARGWPSWRQSSQFMALALRAILRGPEPAAAPAAARMTADLRATLDTYRIHLHERVVYAREVERLQRLKQLPGIRHVRRLRASRKARRLLRPVWPLLRAARRRLLP